MISSYFISLYLFYYITLIQSIQLELQCTNKDFKLPIDAQYNVTNYVSNDPHVINVHLIPHTHDDPGWQKTVDQYYYGSNRYFNSAGVQYVLDNVVTELLHNPSRQFTYVEQSFFQRWWAEQSNATKSIVRQLVKEGRLDLSVNGGWVMHDEATTHYTAMIDQTTLGHHFLLKEFGIIPRVGWQIDPFGHSSTQASYLTAGLGFKAYYFNRIDQQDFDKRVTEKSLEFLWKANPSDPEMSIFSGVLRNAYSAPGGFNFESNAEPIMDDPRLHDMNVCLKVQEFCNAMQNYVRAAKGRHVLVTMGDDFNYQNALVWFKNLDKTIHYSNQLTTKHNLHILYSNLTYYTQQKLSENLNLTTKTDDFFPYAEREHSYWTGYFTSRPTLKRYARQMNSFLQVSRQLVAMWHFHQLQSYQDLRSFECRKRNFFKLGKAVALVQHHDAIAGTEKQHVTNDYALRLYEGMKEAEHGLKKIISTLVTTKNDNTFEFCWLRNVSICNVTQQNDEFNIFLYNSLPYQRWISLEIPLKDLAETVEVSFTKGINSLAEIQFFYDVMPSFPVPSAIPYASKTTLLIDSLVGGLSYQTLHIHTKNSKSLGNKQRKLRSDVIDNDQIVLENEKVKITLSQYNGSLTSFSRRDKNIDIALMSQLMYYPTYVGDGQQSGAYIFRPGATEPIPISSGKNDTKLLYLNEKGQFKQARFQFGKYGYLSYILRPNDSYVRIEWTVGSIPVNNTVGKEVVLRVDTRGSIQSDEILYTDANGLMFMERKKNYRPTWKVNISEPVAGNYYPITSGAYIKDKKQQLNLVTDRAQGCSSLATGQVEIMLHRRLVHDDGKGAGENLNETETYRKIPDDPKSETTVGLFARGNVYLGLETLNHGVRSIRDKMNEVFYEPLAAFQKSQPQERILTSNPHFLESNLSLPRNVHLLTLEVQGPRRILVRFLHKFAVNEDEELSKTVRLDLTNIFKGFGKIKQLKEMSLSANQVIKTLDNPTVTTNSNKSNVYEHGFMYKPNYEITLKPMQFRTFKIDFIKK